MTLAELLEEGKKCYPKQAFGTPATRGGAGCVTATIIQGARLTKTGLYTDHPELYDRSTCPICSMSSILFSMMIHLNDIHRWSREKITAWAERK